MNPSSDLIVDGHCRICGAGRHDDERLCSLILENLISGQERSDLRFASIHANEDGSLEWTYENYDHPEHVLVQPGYEHKVVEMIEEEFPYAIHPNPEIAAWMHRLR